MASTLTLHPAPDPDDVEGLLAANGLPIRDVRAKRECFFVARVGDESVGVAGLEPRGDVGLLRSVAVTESARGRGYGSAICDRLEERAADRGLAALYLLTTTATRFFEGRGYEPVDGDDVPEAVRTTDEFAELCPSTATCMRKRLRR